MNIASSLSLIDFVLLCANSERRHRDIAVLVAMVSKLFLVLVFVFHLTVFAPAVAAEQRRTKPLCHDNESLALLQFKESLINDCREFGYSSNYSKVSFWVSESSNCCKWSGVKCDENMGHVVSLDLSSSCLLGNINSSSSLFLLVHLQRLNLAYNDFKNSQIPASFSHLSSLTRLNLSFAGFSNQIPPEILELSKLVSLDLSHNELELVEPNLRSMAQNLTNLKELHLSGVNMLSTLPKTFANLSSLTSLFLDDCHLLGKFPFEILQLPNLQSINVSFNSNLKGTIPEFNQSNSLGSLDLSYTSFSGKLPNSMSNLKFLQHVNVSGCNFFGTIPSSFGNLSQLVSLHVLENRFHGEFPTGIFHLPNLIELVVSFNENLILSLSEFNKSSPLEFLEIDGASFSTKLQHSIGNLKSLSSFIAIECNFFGLIPSSLGNLTQLTTLVLEGNNMHGSIPKPISKLVNLEYLYLDSKNLNVTVEFDLFLKLKNLSSLHLSNNNISLPSSVDNLTQLTDLELKGNNLHGSIPKLISSLMNLKYLRLDSNNLNGTLEFDLFLKLKNLSLLLLSNNNISLPSSVGNLTQLTDLELEGNNLHGSIPKLVSSLMNLEYLSLDSNNLNGTLEFDLFLKLNNLSSLYLSNNNILLPSSVGNLTQLTNLELKGNNLHGSIPKLISSLMNLEYLRLDSNNLNGTLEFDLFLKLNNLSSLHLSNNNISLPSSLGNLTQLTVLTLEGNNLHGSIPKLISGLMNLEHLRLGSNNLNGSMEFDLFLKLKNLRMLYIYNNNISLPSSLGNLTQLIDLTLEGNNLHGSIPKLISSLMNLEYLRLNSNNLNGTLEFDLFLKLNNLSFLYIYNSNISLPSSLGNLTQLTDLELEGNNLHGSIPELISKLVNLEYLYLDSNNLNGTMEFDLFLKLNKLRLLYLSNNTFSLLTKRSTNATFPKLEKLILRDCHLQEFPNFLRNQGQLLELDLSQNEIHGQVPKWMQNAIANTEMILDLSSNFLTGFDEFPIFPFSSKLEFLRLDSNKLQGSLPIPPPSIIWYSAPNNKLIGEIPHSICNLSSIVTLDLSNNSLSGLLPQCLGNLNSDLLVLNLHRNNFYGTIPQLFPENNELKMIDFSQNQLQGPIPRSLANCANLEVLNLGDNQINDSFPFWLGGLSKLKVLILQSNRFYGAIGNSNIRFDFSRLHVVDLSNNDITGQLPSQYFETWKAMQILNEMSLSYMEANTQYGYYRFSMTFLNKGNEMVFEKILDYFLAIDLSNNKFEGEIPKVIGHLKGLKLLNLSNNFLTGHIPQSLGNLTELESLDLSHNKLSGVIPLQLVQLTFLAVFSVSHNHLTGHIPSGKQFDTFPNTSFIDNPQLCGSPLSKKCENFEHSHSPASMFVDNQNWKFLFEFSWTEVVMGYGCGFVIGLVLGITKKHDWFTTLVVGQQTTRSMNWRQLIN